MTEPLHAYVVGMQWSDNRAGIARVIATKPEEASAIAVVIALRSEGASGGGLTGVMVQELPLDWLHMAVRAIESGKVAGDIVKLVQPEPPRDEAAERQAAEILRTEPYSYVPPGIKAQENYNSMVEALKDAPYPPDGAA